MNLKKFLILIGLLIGIGFLINTRRVKSDDFNLMVLIYTTEVYENCIERRKLKITDRLNHTDSLYNYYVDYKYKDICKLSVDSIQEIMKKHLIESFKDDWKFVF